MGDIVLFSTFGFVSASCCLSVSHDARITPFFRTAICSEQDSKSQEMNLMNPPKDLPFQEGGIDY